MSGDDRLAFSRDISPRDGTGTASGDSRLSAEAFEKAKEQALSSISKAPFDTQQQQPLNSFYDRPSPWKIPPAGPPKDSPHPNPFPGPPKDSPHPNPFPAPPGKGDHDGPPPLPNPGDVLKGGSCENFSTKLKREAFVIGGGVGQSFFYGIANLPDHIPQIASSIVIGGTLAAMSKAGKLGAATSLVIGTYFTSRFVLDTLHDHRRWEKFSDAVKDTWHSDEHTWKNLHIVRNTLGNYTFDTSLSLASGYIGYKNPKLGEWLLTVLKIPPIVPNTPPPFNPRLATTSMYLSIMPPAGTYDRYGDRYNGGWQLDVKYGPRLSRMPDLDRDERHRQDSEYDSERNRYERDNWDNYRSDRGKRDGGDRNDDAGKNDREKNDKPPQNGDDCDENGKKKQ